MAKKNVFVHLDMNKQELQNAKAQNLTTVQIVALAATLVAGDKGLFVYDTTLNKLFAWNGTAFENVTPAPPQVGQNRGGVAHTDAEPANLINGDYVIFTSAGTLTNFVPGEVVQIGDLAFYNGATATWDLVQGNVVQATETVAGVVKFATTAELNSSATGVVVTPLDIANVIGSQYTSQNVILQANVPLEIIVNSLPKDVKFFQIVGNAPPNFEPVEISWYYAAMGSKIVIESNISISPILVVILK